MRIVQLLCVICAASVIDAATIALNQCEMDRLFLMYAGACSMDSQDFCHDLCTGVRVESEEDCTMTAECCWNGDECMMKSIESFNVLKAESSSPEPKDSPSATLNEEDHLNEDNLKRTKRQARGSFKANVEKENGGWTATARGNQKVGRNGNVWAEGRYQHPTGAWGVNAGYEHKTRGGRITAGARYQRPTGAWGVNAGYEHKIRGGSITAGAEYQRNPWGQSNHRFSIGFSKRWRK